MQAVVIFLMGLGMSLHSADASEAQVLVTFDGPGSSDWMAVNDTVMGGRSDGGLEVGDGVLRFSGELSLENNGGFSSIRHAVNLDLSDRSGIRLRVRGDGRSYQLRLHTDSRYYGRPVAYSGTFATKPGEWIEVDVPFDQLSASFRGRQLGQYRFDPSQIELLGILLADKQPGPFNLEIERLLAY